jgi:hypothetical protein
VTTCPPNTETSASRPWSGRAIGLIELVDLDAAISITDELSASLERLSGEPIRLGGLSLNCADHVWLSPALAPTLGTFREVLVGYFARMHHEPRLARERAEGVVELLREHLEVSA